MMELQFVLPAQWEGSAQRKGVLNVLTAPLGPFHTQKDRHSVYPAQQDSLVKYLILLVILSVLHVQ